MSSLADEFNRSGGRPIEHEGRVLHLSYWIEVAPGDRLVIRFLRAAKAPLQGLGLTAENCQLRVDKTLTKNMVLWRDTAPETVQIEIVNARESARVGLMNQWRDEKYGATMLGINNAAMKVDAQPDGSFLCRCSDGWGAPDFNDLVFKFSNKHPEGAV